MSFQNEEISSEEEIKKKKIRGIVIAIVSAIMLLIFILPMLLSLYRGLRPPPPPVMPTAVQAPISWMANCGPYPITWRRGFTLPGKRPNMRHVGARYSPNLVQLIP